MWRPVPIRAQLRTRIVNVTQITTVEADAADETAISGVCKQALQEEGRLDVFFANVRSLHFLVFLNLLLDLLQAGIASYDRLESTTTETFMNVMRVNALSCVYISMYPLQMATYILRWGSVFLAIKYASAAMKTTNPSKGKEFGGGSIILTASGEYFIVSLTAEYSMIISYLQWLVCDLELGPLIVSYCPNF